MEAWGWSTSAAAPDGTEVALKRLTLHGSAEDIARARQRIEREAEVLTRLDHPNIVELLDVVDDGDEVTLVMAYLTGGTLADRVARHGPAPGRRGGAPGRCARRARWRRRTGPGVVHRDIKPGNVLFDADGVPHLADFGVASSRDDTAGLTAIGTVVGTPGFMAPEQARGEAAGQASDVFALGRHAALRGDRRGPLRAGRRRAADGAGRAGQGAADPARSLPTPLRQRLQAMLDPRPERAPVGRRAGRRPGRHRGATARRAAAVVAGRCGRPAAGLAVAALVAGLLVAAARDR